MKRFLTLVALSALAVPALTAAAGECAEGFDCSNICPLAQQANTLRASGGEAAAVSPAVRASVAAAVERNLERV